jgi:hypothetical protein
VNGKPAIKYVIANTGDTAAKVVELSTKLWHEQAGGTALRYQYPGGGATGMYTTPEPA